LIPTFTDIARVRKKSAMDGWILACKQRPPKIVVIQRDNIGDLVLTTPLFRAMRQEFPSARIDAVVNSYNAAVLDRNPDLDTIFAYVKAKHRSGPHELPRIYFNLLRVFWGLRRHRYDLAVLVSGNANSLKFALAAGATHVAALVPPGQKADPRIDIAVPDGDPAMHTVKRTALLLTEIFGRPVESPNIPACSVYPDTKRSEALRRTLCWDRPDAPLIAVHISARWESQRRDAEQWVEALNCLHSELSANILLLWSPGTKANKLHPGDDFAGEHIVRRCAGLRLVHSPTGTLPDLIAALSIADLVLCSDGGAMHLAAAMAKPTVCMFGISSPEVWHPWKTPHVVLRAPSCLVRDLATDEIMAAVKLLLQEQSAHQRLRAV
jgi:heptosyltransferase III